ncbi:MAG: exodeoxyribonuclease VII small subunit [Planctomycetota bacterium]|jgi:exodeoxyribonuclease VII small subunit
MAKRKKEGFEEHLEVLERLVDELESGELTLEGSMERYQEGVKRLKTCYEMLRKAEQQVKILVRDSDGELREEPFGSDEA